MISKSLIGKFFILRQAVGHSQVMLSRGRVIAKADEMFPMYLCEVWPHDNAVLTARSQIIVTIDDLKSAFLFDDEAIWQEHFRDIVTQLEKIRKQAEARQKAAERRAKRQQVDVPTSAPEGVQFVALDEDQMQELLKKIQGLDE